MATADHVPPSGALPGSGRTADLTRAWVFVALIPVAFMLAFALGEGLYAVLGYKPEEGIEPLWVALAAGAPATALFLVPCVAAVVYGNRARALGRRAGLVPLAVGGVLGLWMLVTTVVSLIAL